MIKRLFFAILMFMGFDCRSQAIRIIPYPQSVKPGNGSFTINAKTKIVAGDKSLESTVDYLNDYLDNYYGMRLKTRRSGTGGSNAVLLQLQEQSAETGAYTLTVGDRGVRITGGKEGIFYGIQSLIQLLPPEKSASFSIPHVAIEDAPAFAYRGLHLDVSRHFFPVDFIKRYIDFIALFKLNTFHWHLTDDQGWRIEIKKYPLLTEVGGWRNGTIIGHHPGTGNDNKRTGGYYTQEEIREVVKYAADRMITIIPEIEMPGHASAAIAAYPFLSCFPEEKTVIPGPNSQKSQQEQANGKIKMVQETWGIFPDVFCPSEQTFAFLKNVLSEVIELFPSKYIHIGGDECPKTNWKRSAFCQQLIKENNLKDEHGLQSYFIKRIEQFLNSKGRSIIGWDEILEGGLAPNATVMSWRGEQGGIEAATLGHDVIMTPGEYCYFDHSELQQPDSLTIGGYLPLERVYHYNPVPRQLAAAASNHVLGAQANVWTEYMENARKIEYMIFPRLAALSEVLWTKPANKNFDQFRKRLPALKARLNLMDVGYNHVSMNAAE